MSEDIRKIRKKLKKMSEIKLNNYPTKRKLFIKNELPKDLVCLKEVNYPDAKGIGALTTLCC